MFLDLGPLKLHYEVSGEGRPLILLHGNGEDISIFDRAVPLLEKHFTVYRIDTRCHGKSTDMGNIRYDLIAEDLNVFILLLKIRKPIVFGFSDGGIAALLLEIKHPGTAGSLIVSGANTSPRALKLWFRISAWNAFHRTRSKLIDLMLSGPHIQEEELKAQIKEEEQRSKEIDKFEDYVKTDDYIKDTAEDKLGLVDPNEITFKPSK